MHQRAEIYRALKRLPLDELDPQVRAQAEAFLTLVRNQHDDCWEALVPAFRRSYYDAFDAIIPALFATDDALIVYLCCQYADLTSQREIAVLQRFIRDCNAAKHEISLRYLEDCGVPELLPLLRERRAEWEAGRIVMEYSPEDEIITDAVVSI